MRLIFLFVCAPMVLRVLSAEEEPRSDTAKVAAQIEIGGFLKLAGAAIERNNVALAETFYERLLNVDAPDAEKRDGLLQFGEFFEKRKATTKAIAVYERFSQMFPRDARTYDVLLRLAAMYRETGAYQLAIARYYSVLNSVLKIQQADLGAYKNATLKAQFEIAETYFLA